MCKTQQTQNFYAPRLSWYLFARIWRPIQPSHLKNHEFHFFTKLPTKPSSFAVVHRPTWPGAKANQLKTFVHQDFHGIHLGAFGGQSNPHLSKTTNFVFFTKLPTKPSTYAVAMCKTLRTQNFLAPRISWYSVGNIWRPFQPSHLKNPEFHFFTKLPTKPSRYVVVHRPTWPCAKPNQLKSFVHQDFHGIHLGAFGGQSNPHISKTTNFIFSQNSPPSHFPMSWPCAKPSELKTFVHQEFRRIQLGTFGGFSNTHISKTTNFIFSENSPPSNVVKPWCTDQLGHVQNPTNSKLLCTKTFMVLIWEHLEANPTLTSQKPQISFLHKTPHQAI